MSKALTGAAELAGALGMSALAFFNPELIALPGFANAITSLALTGLATEAGAIAQALTANRGQNITTRQPAAFRQVVYGTQRIGGTLIYPSTTGSHLDQYNRVIVLATHQLSAITGLYLDGRLVYWIPGRTGYTTYGNSDFGGDSDGSDHTGPNGSIYNFGDSQVYCEPRFGNQADGDVIGGLTANDPNWAANGHGSPWVGGCAYAYLKIEYNQANFPQDPEIRFTVQGKPVYDPRTGQTAYSHNPALILNDILTDPQYGLNDTSVNQAQLIAAANICAEQVWSAGANAYEDRYACHWHYDTSTGIGDIIDTVLATMGARLCRIGGQWYIFPAAWIAPAASYTADNLTGPVQWASKRAQRELFNEVRGTYTAPNFPYNIAGNYYDTNGFANGAIQNNFGFAFQPTNYPAYAQDADHGYASNQYLNQDGGVLLTKELGLPAVMSISQAQRLAKIALRRNRQQGAGKLSLNLKAFSLQDCDTFQMTFAQEGWTDKVLEVTKTEFKLESGGSGQPPQCRYSVEVQETDASVYEDFGDGEEQTIYAVPAMPQNSYVVAPPTSVAALSNAGTALQQQDGTIVPRIELTWDTPEDVLVTQLQLRYKVATASVWTDGGLVDAALNAGFISPIVSGLVYDVAIRSRRSSGATSVWVEIDGLSAGLVLAPQTLDGVGIGSLVGEAYTNGTAAIDCTPFSALVGSSTLSIFPSGAVRILIDGTIGGSGASLLQQTQYYVYYVDPTYVGGDVTPIATTNRADFQGKLGYFLIDSIITPYRNSSGSSVRYAPSTFSDTGSRSTTNPQSAYDGDTSTAAIVSGSATASFTTGEEIESDASGDCTWSGFPAITTTVDMTLSIAVRATFLSLGDSSSGEVDIIVSIAGVTSTLVTLTTNTTQTYTADVPSGTNLAEVSVEVIAGSCSAAASSGTTHSSASANCSVPEISIA